MKVHDPSYPEEAECLAGRMKPKKDCQDVVAWQEQPNVISQFSETEEVHKNTGNDIHKPE